MQIITSNAGLYSNIFSNIFEMFHSSKSSAAFSSAVSNLGWVGVKLRLLKLINGGYKVWDGRRGVGKKLKN